MSQVITKLQKGGSFTIDGIKYDATPEFINALTTHLRDTAGTDAQTLAGLSNALQNGQDLRYDSAANTISGMDGVWSGITEKQNERRRAGSSNWRKWWEAQFDTDAHRFRNALSAIGSFHYQVPKAVEETPDLKDIYGDTAWFDYITGDDGTVKWSDNSSRNAGLMQRLDDMTAYLRDPETGKKTYRLASEYTPQHMSALQGLYDQNKDRWDDTLNQIKERARNNQLDDADKAFLKNFFITNPEAAAQATQSGLSGEDKQKWQNAGYGDLIALLGGKAHLNDDGSISLNDGESWGWNLGDLEGRNIYFNDDFYKSRYGVSGAFNPFRTMTLYNNRLYALNNPTLAGILNAEGGFNALKDAGDWSGADDIILTRFTDAARENPGEFRKDKYSEFLSDHPEYRFTNLTGLYDVEGLNPNEQLVQLYNLDTPVEGTSPYREYAPKYVVLDSRGKYLRDYDNFNGRKIRGASAKDLGAYNRVTSEMGGNPAYTGRYYEDIIGKNGEPTGYRVYYNPQNSDEDMILHMPGINAAGVSEDQDIKVPAELGKILIKKFQDQDFLTRLIGNAQNKKDFQMLMSQLVQSWFRQTTSDRNHKGALNSWWGLFSESYRKKWKDLGFKDQDLNDVMNAWNNSKRNSTAGNRDTRQYNYLVTAPNIPQEKNGGSIEKHQFGGVAGGSTNIKANTARQVDAKNTNPNNSAGITEIGGKNWTDADTADMFALVADLSSLGLAIAPGMGIAAAGTGAAGSTARLYADLSRGTKGAGLNYLLNLGMDAATMIPVLGAGIKGVNIAKTVGKVLPTIIKAASVYGLGAGVVDTAKKIASGQKFTVRDVDMLVNAITAGVGLGKSGGFGRSSKASKSKVYSENFKVGNKDITLDDAAIKKVLASSDQPKALRDAIRVKAPNATNEEVAKAAENLLTTKRTMWQRVRGKDGDIVMNAKKKPSTTTNTVDANGNKFHDWWYGVGDKQKAYNAQLRGEPLTRQEIVLPTGEGAQLMLLEPNLPAVVRTTSIPRQSIALPQLINPFTMANRQENKDVQPSGFVMQPLYKKGGKIEKGQTGLKLNLDILDPNKVKSQGFTPKIDPMYKAPSGSIPTFVPNQPKELSPELQNFKVVNPMTKQTAIDTRTKQSELIQNPEDDLQGTFPAKKWDPDLNVPLNWARSLYAMKQSDKQLKNFLNRPQYQASDLLLNAPRYINTGTGNAYRNQANQLRLFKPVTSDAMQNDLMARDRQREALNAELQGNLADSQEYGQYKAGLDDFNRDYTQKKYNIAEQNKQLRWQHEIENVQAKNANIAEKSKFFDQAAYATQDWWNRNYQMLQGFEGSKAYTQKLKDMDDWYRQERLVIDKKNLDDNALAQELASLNARLALKKQELSYDNLYWNMSPWFRGKANKNINIAKSGGKISSDGKRSAVTYSRDPYPELLLQNAKDSTEIVKQLNDAVIKLLLQTKPINVH